MAEALKILGQTTSATTLSDLYTVPSSNSATISSIVVCNRGSSSCTFRISVAINGASDSNEQYLFYDQFLDAKSTYIATIGITLGDTDKVRVQSSAADVSFNLFGVEVN